MGLGCSASLVGENAGRRCLGDLVHPRISAELVPACDQAGTPGHPVRVPGAGLPRGQLLATDGVTDRRPCHGLPAPVPPQLAAAGLL